jgi:hypothetical protein
MYGVLGLATEEKENEKKMAADGELIVNVLFFASAREAAGTSSIHIQLGSEEKPHTSILR